MKNEGDELRRVRELRDESQEASGSTELAPPKERWQTEMNFWYVFMAVCPPRLRGTQAVETGAAGRGVVNLHLAGRPCRDGLQNLPTRGQQRVAVLDGIRPVRERVEGQDGIARPRQSQPGA